MALLSLPSIEEIRKLRRKLGLTQAELAKLAQVSQSLVSQIESGEVDPRLSTLRRIVDALNREETGREVFAEDLLVRDVVSVSPDDLVTTAASIMWAKKISQLPVLEDGKNLGSISEKTITAEIAKGGTKDLARRTVREVMSEPFPMVGMRSRMEVVLSLLQESPAVLVLDGGKVSGIITKADVLPRVRSVLAQGEEVQARPATNSSK